MSEQELNDKIQLKVLLETYSLEEIQAIFQGVDKKILSLLEIAEEDFLKLSNDFKGYHNHTKEVNAKTKTLFQLIKSQEAGSFILDLDELWSTYGRELNVIDYHYDLLIEFIGKIADKIRLVFFPLKNYGQNLTSFKFLLANLNFSSYCESDDCELFKELSNSLSHRADQTRENVDKLIHQLNTLRKTIKLSKQELHKSKREDLIELKNLYKENTPYIAGAKRSYQEALKLIPDIETKFDKSSEHIGKIITNLQYHDIIRQKMEHIQETHGDLIGELWQFKEVEEDEVTLHNQAKCFIRVRDIAGLQAAQLIQSNREYQNAIEIITTSFLEVGDTLTELVDASSHIAELHGSRLSSDDTTTLKRINSIRKIHHLFSLVYGNYQNTASHMNDLMDTMSEYFNSLKRGNAALDKEFSKISGMLENKYASFANESKPYLQLKQLFSEMDNTIKKLSNVMLGLNDMEEEIIRYQEIEANTQLFDELVGKINANSDIVEKQRADIFKYIHANKRVAANVIENIRQSVGQIKYYKYFDNVIDNLIKELNSVNYNLKTQEHRNSQDDNLEHLKKYYTMETEHQIHNHILSGNEADEWEIEINDEDSDIEFF
ncbi:MAG: hypothetical protein R6U66_04680 [Bacteroidales bacterium]